MSMKVIKAGVLSTLQDLGRFGYQHFGVPVGGVMDDWSHRLANILVGNPEDEATLEFTLQGPSLLFESTQLIAICGANMAPTIDGYPVPQERPVLVKAGARLDFAMRRNGVRTYLAVRGGYDAKSVMNSRSTFLRGSFGGFNGGALRKGDAIAVRHENSTAFYSHLIEALNSGTASFIADSEIRIPSTGSASPKSIRVTVGPQWDAFSDEAQRIFFGAEFCVSPQSDRMGFRLSGHPLGLRQPIEMVSEAISFGSIQVPPDGNPIILMADRQTTGGYPKIAYIATVDLPFLAQTLPNEGVRFQLISQRQSQQLYLEREDDIQQLQKSIEQLRQQ